MNIKVAVFGSPEYLDGVSLRYRILRQPLGLVYTGAQLEAEREEVHIVSLEEAKVVGVLLLRWQENGVVKMRQVAVDADRQREGIGRSLVQYAEIVARENGYVRMELHARDTAIPFYTALGYTCTGEPFTEVGIAHRKMYREL